MDDENKALSAPEAAPAPEFRDHAPLETDTTPEADAPEAEPDTTTDEATEAAKGESAERDRVKETIGKLTRRQREADRRAEIAELTVQRLLQQMSQQPQQPAPQTDTAPDPSKFPGGEYDPAYMISLADHRAEQTFNRKLREASEHQRRAHMEVVARQRETTFAEREATIEADLPDYRDLTNRAAQIINQSNPVVVFAVKDAIAALDNGPEVFAYLGQNEAEARRIRDMMHPADAVVALGRIAERLSNQREAAVKTVTSAPKPPPMVRGQGRGSLNPLDMPDDEFRDHVLSLVKRARV